MQYPNFCGPAYTLQSLNVAAELCMNWYPEITERRGAKVPIALLPCPGFELFSSSPVVRGRGALAINGRAFTVCGNVLEEVTSAGGRIVRGTMQTNTSPASLATNGLGGNQLAVASGGFVYVLDLGTNVFEQALDSNMDPVTATQLGFVNGYIVALDVPTSTFKWSAIEDATTWDAADQAQRNTAPDDWVGMLVSQGQVFLFGQQKSDVWVPTEDPDQAFHPIQGAFFDQGLAATFAAGVIDNTPIFYSQNDAGNGMVFRLQGTGGLERISDHGVETAIQRYTMTSDAYAWTYQDQGHSFFVLVFPTEGKTWVWDAATQMWHERGAWDPGRASFAAYGVQAHLFAFNRHLVQDRQTGNLYTMDVTFPYDIGGGVIRRVRRAPYVVDELRNVFFHRLQLDVEVGHGNRIFPAQTPQVMVRWSNDGAQTWSHERQGSAGRLGQYGTRVLFQPLGRGRNRVFEVSASDPVPWRVSNALLDVTVGLN